MLVDYINTVAENISSSTLTRDSLKNFILEKTELGVFYSFKDKNLPQNRIDATQTAIMAGLFTVEQAGANYNMLTPEGCNFILGNKDVQSFIEKSFGNVAINVVS